MYEYQASVVQVHDGDTLRFDVDQGFDQWHHNLDVRLSGIDCPELGRSDGLGEKARDFVMHWCELHPGPVVLNTIKDRTEKYGRFLGLVTAADGAVLINDLLAAELARPYTGHGPRPWA